jgi:hypothetical protein
MAWLRSACPIRLNRRHQLFEQVFSGRYKAQLVESSGNGYLSPGGGEGELQAGEQPLPGSGVQCAIFLFGEFSPHPMAREKLPFSPPRVPGSGVQSPRIRFVGTRNLLKSIGVYGGLDVGTGPKLPGQISVDSSPNWRRKVFWSLTTLPS